MRLADALDSKRINRALFGAYYEDDIYDQFCGRWPRAMRAFHWRIDPAFMARQLIFIHVPRAAGTSIARALGGRPHLHHSIRYYRAINPGFTDRVDSFAVLRDPFERFASAYNFVRAGGADNVRLSKVFAAKTAHIQSVDDYLSFLEGRPPLEMDFVMRPQSWFITDLTTGEVLVKRIFLLGAETAELAAYLQAAGAGPLGWYNRSVRLPLDLTPVQYQRIVALYAADFELIGRLRAQRARDAAALRLAAE